MTGGEENKMGEMSKDDGTGCMCRLSGAKRRVARWSSPKLLHRTILCVPERSSLRTVELCKLSLKLPVIPTLPIVGFGNDGRCVSGKQGTPIP